MCFKCSHPERRHGVFHQECRNKRQVTFCVETKMFYFSCCRSGEECNAGLLDCDIYGYNDKDHNFCDVWRDSICSDAEFALVKRNPGYNLFRIECMLNILNKIEKRMKEYSEDFDAAFGHFALKCMNGNMIEGQVEIREIMKQIKR